MALPTGPLSTANLQTTLVSKLRGKVDKVRTVAVKLGLRPYRVFLIHVKWTGGIKGQGSEKMVSWNEIWPNPRLSIQDRESGGLFRDMTSWGMIEEGMVTAIGISLSYTEDQLLGLGEGGIAILPDREFFWEIREDGARTPTPRRRRFHPDDVPHQTATGWVMKLRKSQKNPIRVTTDPTNPFPGSDYLGGIGPGGASPGGGGGSGGSGGS